MAALAHLMFPPRPTHLAQMILRESIREGDVVIDATAGNGHDTVFLAECVGATGRVLSFDIQEKAIASSRANVRHAGMESRVAFHLQSHAAMAEHVMPATVSVAMFNLGYLPGENHELTTESTETITAIKAALNLLKTGGVLSVVSYPGHEAGITESDVVEKHITGLADQGWRVAKYAMLGTRKPAPFLLLCGKP